MSSKGGGRKPKGKAGKKSVESRSPAEFFAEHKSIAGFDNPGKSLYTTVREFVENSLDAAEEIGQLPTISVDIEQVPSLNISNLYGEAEAEAEPESAAPPKATAASRKKSKAYYRVTVKDNGCGMPHDEIPNMLGRVLSGTKYTLKQARGRFGLGAKMALIWSKMTTAKPLDIYTAQAGRANLSYCSLDLDIHRNEPNVLKHEKLKNDGTTEGFPAGWQGTQISVLIEGNWSGAMGASYKWKILRYMRLLAIITPYAELTFSFRDAKAPKNNIRIKYARRTDVMPAIPKEVKHHPSSVNLVTFTDLLRRAKLHKNMDLRKFLKSFFSNISSAEADRIIEGLGHLFETDMDLEDITKPKMQHIVKYLTKQSWPQPSGDALSPAGAYNIYLGIMKELNPDMIVTHTEKPQVFQGHAFIVEAAVSLGGKSVSQGLNVFRFANRIPLLFEPSSDVIFRTASELSWNNYKINPQQDKLGVFVSFVSTKVPFKGTNKEFISDEIPAIKLAIKNALMRCGQQLKSKIAKRKLIELHKDRKKALVKYIPDVSRSVFNVLAAIVDGDKGIEEHVQKRRRVEQAVVSAAGEDTLSTDDLLQRVQDRKLTADTLRTSLSEHVEKFDAEQALEFATRQGRDENATSQCLYIPMDIGDRPVVSLRHEHGSLTLLRGCCISPV